MKKIKKISIFISIFIFTIILTSTISYAKESEKQYISTITQQSIKIADGSDETSKDESQQVDLTKKYIDPSSFDPGKHSKLDEDTVKSYSNKFLTVLTTIAIIVTVITVMLVGLKIIMSAPSEKAQYKEHLIPIVVGAILVSSIMSVITILINFAEKI